MYDLIRIMVGLAMAAIFFTGVIVIIGTKKSQFKKISSVLILFMFMVFIHLISSNKLYDSEVVAMNNWIKENAARDADRALLRKALPPVPEKPDERHWDCSPVNSDTEYDTTRDRCDACLELLEICWRMRKSCGVFETECRHECYMRGRKINER